MNVAISAIYVISKSGTPLAYYGDSDVDDNDTQILFSGVITAIQSILKELNIGDTNSFETSEYVVMIFNEVNYAIIFLIDRDSKMQNDDVRRLYKRLNVLIKPEIPEDDIIVSLETDLDSIIRKEMDLWVSESIATQRAKESLW